MNMTLDHVFKDASLVNGFDIAVASPIRTRLRASLLVDSVSQRYSVH